MITSTSNAQIKELAKLQKKSRLRDERRIFLVEGPRMVEEIPKERIERLYISESFERKNPAYIRELGMPAEVLSDPVFSYVSDTKNPQGILAVVKRLEYTMEDVLGKSALKCEEKSGEKEKNPENHQIRVPHVIVLDNLQDPGNLGTIFRTAEAAGATGILLSSDSVDVYNPKVIRSTMGAVFRMPFFYVKDLPAAVKSLSSQGIRTYAAHLNGKNVYDEEDYTGKNPVDHIKGAVEFRHVTYQYPEASEPVLKDFSLKAEPGETIALVGESGAGKSTILNLVIGFHQAESGKVLIDGKDLSKIDLRTYRKHLAVVPQTSILFSGTIRDNITYGCENVSEEQLQNVIKAANLSDLIASLPKGLDTMVGEHGGKLSGGQRQRISIARALIRDPKVIVLDEATSALDSISEKLIQQALNNLTEGRTTFIVAHRLSTIRDADRIAVIADGHCTEYGTYDELMALKGEFYQLKQIQS